MEQNLRCFNNLICESNCDLLEIGIIANDIVNIAVLDGHYS